MKTRNEKWKGAARSLATTTLRHCEPNGCDSASPMASSRSRPAHARFELVSSRATAAELVIGPAKPDPLAAPRDAPRRASAPVSTGQRNWKLSSLVTHGPERIPQKWTDFCDENSLQLLHLARLSLERLRSSDKRAKQLSTTRFPSLTHSIRKCFDSFSPWP